MRFTAYRLQFKAPLHIGVEGIGAERIDFTVHSDTLWGALANAYLTLGLPFNFEQPQFFISSAFPYFKTHWFFPLPAGALNYAFTQVDARQAKKIKKIKYVDLPLFEMLINGKQPDFTSLNFSKANPMYLLSAFSPDLEERKLFVVHETPRVTLDRYTDSAAEGQIFYFAQMVFAQQAGLFFLARFEEDSEQAYFEAALRFLGDEGLGADRTVGKGFFDFEEVPLDIQTSQTAEKFIILSLYHPQKEEIDKGLMQGARYTLLTRKGFAFNHRVRGKRRKFVRMFAEGSLFSTIETNGKAPGDIPTVIPAQGEFIPFDVKRYGLAFTLPAAL